MFKKIVNILATGIGVLRAVGVWWSERKKRNYEKSVDKTVYGIDVKRAARILRDIRTKRDKRRNSS